MFDEIICRHCDMKAGLVVKSRVSSMASSTQENAAMTNTDLHNDAPAWLLRDDIQTFHGKRAYRRGIISLMAGFCAGVANHHVSSLGARLFFNQIWRAH